MITREVRGIPDEGDPNPEGLHHCRVHGWRQAGSFRDSLEWHSGSLFSIGRYFLDQIPREMLEGTLEGYDPFSDTPMYASKNSQGNYELYDTAPDIYHFRFLGHSGDFMMLSDGTVRVYNSDIPHGELSVAFTDNENAPWTTVITLTDGNGYKYMFGCADISETPDCFEESPIHLSKSVSGYHLTRITAPNGRSVSFSYSGQLNPVVTPRYGAHLNGRCMSRATLEEEYDNVFSTDGDALKWTFVREGTHILDTVFIDGAADAGKADTIVFRYTTPPGNENSRLYYEQADESCFDTSPDPAVQLTSVSMYGQNGLADAATLGYDNASSGTPKRFLRSVTGMKSGKHSFDYYRPGLVLPPNDTQNTDHWGFWNGSSISDLRDHLVETAGEEVPGGGGTVVEGHADSTYVIVLPGTTIVRRCAADLYDQMTDDAKEANPVYSCYGALTRIHYPHGGTTDIEYEPNRVTRRMNVKATQTIRRLEPIDSLDAHATWMIGGVRVRSLVDTDGHGNSDTTRFSYTDPDAGGRESGILMTMPKYAEAAQYTHRAISANDMQVRTAVAYVNAIGFNNCCGFTLVRDPHVAYPTVTVIHPDNATTEYRFTSIADAGLEDYYSVLTGTPKHVLCFDDWFENYTRVPTCMIPPSIDKKNMRGRPKSTVVRDADGRELKRTEYSYGFDCVTVPQLAFNNILTFCVASYQALSPVLVSTVETERGVSVRTDKTYNALGQVTVTSTTDGSAGSDTLRLRLRYRHETGDTSPARTRLDAAVRTRTDQTGEYLLARERYSYYTDTVRLKSIVSYAPDYPVQLTSGADPFGINAEPARTSSFEYRDAQKHLTKACFPGDSSISYTWNGNNLSSKTENGALNVTHFDWKDQVGLRWTKSASSMTETCDYDAHNRPYKTRDADSVAVSVFHYKIREQ